MEDKDFVVGQLVLTIALAIALAFIAWAINNNMIARIVVTVLAFMILFVAGVTLIWLPAKPEPKAGREEEEKP